MTKRKFLKILFLSLGMMLILSGCTIGFNTGTGSISGSVSDGGIFRTLNKGTTWEQKTLIQGINGPKSFASINIITLALDPSDNKAIYAGSPDNGLFFSYDGADSWQVASNLGKIYIASLAIDPVNKCIIYAASANKVFKSNDCSRTWAQVYFDTDLKVAVTSLLVDFSNNNTVFMGTSRGDIIKSSDQGLSWRALNRLDSQVDKIIINPVNPKIIFAGTNSKGVFRSSDGGNTWLSLDDKLKALNSARGFRDLVIVKADKTTVFLAINNGLIKSTDDGNTWSRLELLTPENDVKINALAVNPFKSDEIYYVTDTTFYRSLDGGKNWTSKKLPTNRAGVKLLIDPKNTSIIYLAVKSLKNN
jgi:photosystem II stability/assembly factor-like uncharacterized protein